VAGASGVPCSGTHQGIASPERATGEGLQRRIHGDQGEVVEFGLRCEEAIKGIAMGHGVTAGMQALLQGDP